MTSEHFFYVARKEMHKLSSWYGCKACRFSTFPVTNRHGKYTVGNHEKFVQFNKLFYTVLSSPFVHAGLVDIMNTAAILFPHHIRVLLKFMTSLSSFSLWLILQVWVFFFFHSASTDNITPGFPWSLSAAALLHTEQVRMSYYYLATIDPFCWITGVLSQEILLNSKLY